MRNALKPPAKGDHHALVREFGTGESVTTPGHSTAVQLEHRAVTAILTAA